MSTASEDHTPTAATDHVNHFTTDSLLMGLAVAFRIAEAAGDQCFAEAGSGHGAEAMRLHALSEKHADRAEELAEAICAASAESLIGAEIQSNTLAVIGGYCWTDERHDRSRESADGSIRRVLAFATARMNAEIHRHGQAALAV
jgi:hypothetical protein